LVLRNPLKEGKFAPSFGVHQTTETGARAGEAWNLRWIDINPEAGTVTITPEKGSRARHSKVTGSLVVMLNRQPHLSEYVFPSVDSIDSVSITSAYAVAD
jgi:integrase